MEGRKDDKEKNRTDLYPVDAFLETCEVLTYGAKKYDPRNWEKGFEWSRAYGALLRHMMAFWQGEDMDPETGISHLAHAHCELIFLQSFRLRGIGRDDRPIRGNVFCNNHAYTYGYKPGEVVEVSKGKEPWYV